MLVFEKRCDALAAKLNERLPDAPADVLEYAGQLHEFGECVDADWEKAAALYTRAAQAGAPLARFHLIANYAVGLHDPAAALWWAAQQPDLLSKECLPASDPLKQAAAFVAEIGGWPTAQLKACTYQAGILARLIARGKARRVSGNADDVKVSVLVQPDRGTILWRYAGGEKIAESRLKAGAAEADLATKPERDELSRVLWFYGVDALIEFGLPPVSEPRWAMTYAFDIEDRLQASSVPIQISVSQ
ncbi:SEL1-like repeat protein [Pseudoduganella danionis]|uniref:Sel1 repeat family protein n=1 Tax=Pseudoduganella danionis TaxID=1890295 RepID=A0ABW9SMG2_9BURK|nr:SEL1-like repeat protein [Pseudoduganella danionis]MTW33181.1 hypothetical protein [Pseudoduganella danionis]